MHTATLKPVYKPVIALCALLMSTAPLAGGHQASEDEANRSCPHHSNVDGHTCSHHGKYGPHGKHGGPRSEEELAAMRERMDKLGLSDAQKQEMGTLFGIYQPRVREILERGLADREALVMAVPGSDKYNSLIGTVSQEAAASAGEMVVLLAELQANAFALLTDEQQDKYQALKGEARAKAEEKAAAKREARKASSDTGYSRKARPLPE